MGWMWLARGLPACFFPPAPGRWDGPCWARRGAWLDLWVPPPQDGNWTCPLTISSHYLERTGAPSCRQDRVCHFCGTQEHLGQLNSPKPKVDRVQMYTADPCVLLALRCFCFLAKSWPCFPFSCVSIFNASLIFTFDCGCAACGILGP